MEKRTGKPVLARYVIKHQHNERTYETVMDEKRYQNTLSQVHQILQYISRSVYNSSKFIWKLSSSGYAY